MNKTPADGDCYDLSFSGRASLSQNRSNRDFIRKAVWYLIDRQFKDREAGAILQEYFLASEEISDETLPDRIETQLTFRDEAKGDKLAALERVAAMLQFVHKTVYIDCTNRKAPERTELVRHMNEAREAIKVLFAPYVDEEYMREMCAVLEQEAIDAGINEDFEFEEDTSATLQ